jgi:hypothetical protein
MMIGNHSATMVGIAYVSANCTWYGGASTTSSSGISMNERGQIAIDPDVTVATESSKPNFVFIMVR